MTCWLLPWTLFYHAVWKELINEEFNKEEIIIFKYLCYLITAVVRKALSGQTAIPAWVYVQAMAGDRNRCAGKGIRDFHLWEDKMRKHPRRSECPVIMVIGHTRLFNECFFSASPLMPIVNVVLPVWLKCIAPTRAVLWTLKCWIGADTWMWSDEVLSIEG